MWAASLILLAGCGTSLQPYVGTVTKEYQLDWRSESKFTIVEVCYNRSTTTPEAVKRLAEDVCVEQGAHAVFADHRIFYCSLVHPVSAIFVCRCDRDGAATEGSAACDSVADRQPDPKIEPKADRQRQ